MTLDEVGIKYGTDKSSNGHGYCEHYQRHLIDPAVILEIGILNGASLKMWHDYFPNTKVIGVDDQPANVEGITMYSKWDDITCILGDATVPETFDSLYFFDVVVDDGSHQSKDILKTFEILWPKLSIDGWYIIEDLKTQFSKQFGGSSEGSRTTRLIHDIIDSALKDGYVECHVYNEIIFIKKIKGDEDMDTANPPDLGINVNEEVGVGESIG